MTVALTVKWIIGLTVLAFLLVEAIVAWNAFRRRDEEVRVPAPLKGFSRRRLEAAWMLTPAVILLSLVAWTAHVIGHDVRNVPADPGVVVHVTAHKYYWQIRYPHEGGEIETTLNHLHLPAGVTARVDIDSADVVHGFWVPELGIKESIAPGASRSIGVTAPEPGQFNIVCAELCGDAHYAMRGFVEVESPAEFHKWLDEQIAHASTASLHDSELAHK